MPWRVQPSLTRRGNVPQPSRGLKPTAKFKAPLRGEEECPMDLRKHHCASLAPQREERIHLCRTPRRDIAGKQNHSYEEQRDQRECQRVSRADLVKEAL